MTNNDQLFELMTKMYSEMQEGFKRVDAEMQGGFKRVDAEMQEGFKKVDAEMQEGFKKVNAEIQELKERVIKIEDDHGKKLTVLLDGYKQNADKLDRIEKEVTRHEEIILRRVK